MTRSRHSWYLGMLALIGLLDSGCKCLDCDGFYLEAWIRADATTLAGSPLPDVTIRADAVRPLQTWTGTTDANGRTILHIFTTAFPQSVRVSAEPPPDYAPPEPITIAPLTPNDTAPVFFTLEPSTVWSAASNTRLDADGRSRGRVPVRRLAPSRPIRNHSFVWNGPVARRSTAAR
jgi:hypothetical protein